ncbi:MAG: TM0106 family RecB-like putative nuclease [Acidimicrobiia bacterium]|nr:MAG: TM0106 family RecB-like putative nuclease [Acidimicrobiia bacterium]
MTNMTETETISDQETVRRLGGSDIGRCLTKIHHDRFTSGTRFEDDIRIRDIERGFEHETSVLSRIESIHPGLVRISDIGEAAAYATLAAMDDGAPIIVGGRFISDETYSAGAPDILVRLDDGYAPVEIKNHMVLGTSGIPASVARLESIQSGTGEPAKFRGNRRRDLYQVAHYRSLLLEAGYASDRALAGVVGSEDPYVCLWVDLSDGESPLWEEYQFHRRRTDNAIAFGRLHPDTPLEQPWQRGQCARCDWEGLCRSQLVAVNDITLLTNVSSGERRELASSGIRRIDQIAGLEPGDPRVGNPSIVFQARARTAQRLLRFTPAQELLHVPSAEIEVDFDIETYRGSIYLAGFLTTRDGSSVYEPIADWTGTHDGERKLVKEMFEKLAMISRPQSLVLHWTDYEQRTLSEAGQRHQLSIPGYASVQDWFEQNAVDLCDWARKSLVSPNGYSLKVVAPLSGFSWRDDDPGGRQSEIWFERFVQGDGGMRERLLQYNEDDVLAQLTIRQWLRDQDSGSGPGSAVPSVLDWPRNVPGSSVVGSA